MLGLGVSGRGVRVWILRQCGGIYDGVSLGRLLPGLIYEPPVSLGVFLISRGDAEKSVAK
jgi:hypothetical protein